MSSVSTSSLNEDKGNTSQSNEELKRLRAKVSRLEAAVAKFGQAETEFREIEERYRALYENIPLMYFTMDSEGIIVSVNAHGVEQLGYKREELVGEPVLKVFHEEDRPAVGQQFSACVNNPGSVRRWDFRKIRKDGSVLWVRESARAVKSGGETTVLVVCEDVTKSKQAERQLIDHRHQLQSLASELALTEERERRRIALGLHDQIGQTLAMARTELDKLSRADAASADRIREFLDEAIQAVRSLTFELSSPILYELGLEPAIQSFGESTVEKNGMRFHFRSDDKPKLLPEKTKISLFRVVRELLFNTVKHSRARNVTVSVHRSGDRILISVQDDGVGFDSAGAGETVSPTGGFGLFSIHEQMELIGGRFEIESAPGKGTRAAVIVPLAQCNRNEAGDRE